MTRPSSAAYSGAVIGDHSFLKHVTIAVMKPPIAPTITSGMAPAGFSVKRFQTKKAEMTAMARRMPVLFTAP